MKKIFLVGIVGIGLLCSNAVNASHDCEYSCTPSYDLTSKTSRFFSSVTGQNFLAEKIAGSLLKKEIKKTVDGDLKVKLDSYSVRDLKKGKFKSLAIAGKNLNIDGIYITQLNVKTLCEYNYISVDKKGKTTIMHDMPISIDINMNENDLNKTMKSKDYERLLGDINSVGGSFNIFKIDSTQIKIKNDKVYYIMKIAIPFIRGTQDVVLSASLKVKDGNIVFANTEFVNNKSSFDLGKFSNILNYINPLDFSVKILENKNADINIQNVSVQDGIISMHARMTVKKDTVTE